MLPSVLGSDFLFTKLWYWKGAWGWVGGIASEHRACAINQGEGDEFSFPLQCTLFREEWRLGSDPSLSHETSLGELERVGVSPHNLPHWRWADSALWCAIRSPLEQGQDRNIHSFKKRLIPNRLLLFLLAGGPVPFQSCLFLSFLLRGDVGRSTGVAPACIRI